MDESRRSVLKKAGLAALGAGCSFPLLRALASAGGHVAGTAGTKQWAMVVDVQKCLKDEVRQACAQACHQAHNVPDIPDPKEEIKWIWGTEYEKAFPDQAHPHTADSLKNQPVLVLCNHCTTPPCTKVCPTKATWKREQDGIVMMDMHRCIGCRYCVAACPYGARSFNYRDPRPHLPKDMGSDYPTRTIGVVEKCEFCAERLRNGLQPACVEAANKVPGGEEALTFGDLRDPDSSVSRLLREKHTIVRKPGAGTGPNVFYIV